MRIDIIVISFYQERTPGGICIDGHTRCCFLFSNLIVGVEVVVEGVSCGEIPVEILRIEFGSGFLYGEGAAAENPCDGQNSQSEGVEFHDKVFMSE